METMKIGVIVPIYNVMEYLDECIQSILNQTYINFELILVDDGSTDNSPYICDKYAEQDNRIKVIHKTNGGLVSARKAGLNICEADYAMYVDGDDWIEKNMLQFFVDIISEYHCDVIVSNYKRNIEGTIENGKFHFEDGFYDKKLMQEKVYPKMICWEPFYESGVLPSLCGKLYKTELLKKYQNSVDDRITLGEDAACTYPLLATVDSCYLTEKALYNYRVNMQSMTQSYNAKQTVSSTILINSLFLTFGEDSVFFKQILQYHGFITMRNIYNVGMSGLKTDLIRRCRELKCFVKDTNFARTYRTVSTDVRKLGFSQRFALLCLSKNVILPVLLVYIFKNKVKK